MSFPVAVAPEVGSEFPGLALEARQCRGPARADAGVIERLNAIASRIRGATAVEMRREPVPASYRGLYRQLGIDPDTELPPAEAAVGRRLFDGGVRPHGALACALELAVLETWIPVYAFDASEVEGRIELRPVRADEEVMAADGVPRRGPGRLVIADDAGPLCWLFEEARGRGSAEDGDEEFVLLAVGAPGVPDISLDEALGTAAGAIDT